MTLPRVTLITGGARSGKSRRALELAAPAEKKVFIATAEIFDKEMADRIERHQIERGNTFVTLEAPIRLADAIREVPLDTEVVVVDCLTVWLGNLLHHKGAKEPSAGDLEFSEVIRFIDVLKSPPVNLILVANEVGMGLVPETALGRRFRDLAGRVNQEAARIASTVLFMVSGIPVTAKETRP
jgi:adenosylcobinamide kinase/adenosylcobinamide-phosphate guanylyltransferase